MDNYNIFVTDALANYDKNMKEQNKMLKNAESFEFINSDDDIENDRIVFFDKNDNKILEAQYEAISTYYSALDSWIWAWGNPSFKKKWTETITKILKYGLSLDPLKNYHLKLELVNSRFIIADPIQIDIHLAVASTLSKVNNIYSIVIPSEPNNEIPSIYKYNIEKNNIKNNSNDFIEKKTVRIKILKEYEGPNVKIQYIFLFNIKKF